MAALTAVTLIAPSGAYAAVTPVSDTAQKMPTFNGGVYALAYDGDTIYVGGSFTAVNWGGKRNPRTDLAAINAKTGALLPWAPTANGKVDAIAVDPATHTVYVGGAFSKINGTGRDSLAGISGSTGALTSFKHSLSGSVEALAVGHGLLYLGGKFTAVDKTARSNLAAFTLSSGALNAAWAPTTDEIVYAITPDTNRVYLGGKFHKIDGVKGTAKLGAVNPTTGAADATFKPVLSILVYAVALGPDGGVYAAEGGQGGNAVAYSSTGAVRWTFTADGDVHALAYLGGVLYLGGHFDNACADTNTGVHGICVDGSVSRVKFAAVDGSTGALLSWDPSGNGVHGVFAMAANSSLATVAAAGEFTTLGGVGHGRFAQFH